MFIFNIFMYIYITSISIHLYNSQNFNGVVYFTVWLGKQKAVYRLRTALKTDARICLMSEIINGISIIKMYTWEKPFEKLVSEARRLVW